MADAKIVPMEEKHFERAREIYNYYIINTTVTFHLEPLSADGMRGLLYFPGAVHGSFAILRDGAVAGYAALAPYSERGGYDATATVSVYLDKGYTRMGLGRTALGFLESYAREKNIHVLLAGICSENAPSIGLFVKTGYVECGRFRETGLKFGRRLDVLYYQKLLD